LLDVQNSSIFAIDVVKRLKLKNSENNSSLSGSFKLPLFLLENP